MFLNSENFYWKHLLVYISSVLFVSNAVYSQINPRFSNFGLTRTLLNPAFVGLNNRVDILILNSNKFNKVEKNPNINTLIIDTRLSNYFGLGTGLINESLGAFSRNQISIDFSCYLKLSKTLNASFGVKTGIIDEYLDLNKLVISKNPPLVKVTRKNITPILGFGIVLFTKKWNFGFARSNFLDPGSFNLNRSQIPRKNESMTYYNITGGYSIYISKNIKLIPSLMYGLNIDNLDNGSLMLKGEYQDKIKLGIGISSNFYNYNLSGNFEFKLFKNVHLGYSREINYSLGNSNEFFIKFTVLNRRQNQKNKTFKVLSF